MDPLQNTFDQFFKIAFEQGFRSFEKAKLWFKKKNEERDFLGKMTKKYRETLEDRYNLIRVMGMHSPRPLRELFIRVNILKSVASYKRIPFSMLKGEIDWESKRYGVAEHTLPGIEVANAYDKFIVLGKPGAGKTTFLKSLIFNAIDGELKVPSIPIFISLKDVSDSGSTIIEFLALQFEIATFKDCAPFIHHMLGRGKFMLLFDGLDEVNHDRQSSIINEIKFLSDKYDGNRFIISCRIASYNQYFEEFTDVEIADFGSSQIKQFVNKWFEKDPNSAITLLEEIAYNVGIRDLASVPLLLILICIAFDKTFGLPANRSALYEESIDALLTSWDGMRRIRRLELLSKFTKRRKIAFFRLLAYDNFIADRFFMSRNFLVNRLDSFLSNIVNSDLSPYDSKEIIDILISNTGIILPRSKDAYSFAHLTFQEFFAASCIRDSPELMMKSIDNHFGDQKWNEFFCMLAEMLTPADTFILSLETELKSIKRQDSVNNILRIANSCILDSKGLPKTFGIAFSLYAVLSFGVARNRAFSDERFESAFNMGKLIRVIAKHFDVPESEINDLVLERPINSLEEGYRVGLVNLIGEDVITTIILKKDIGPKLDLQLVEIYANEYAKSSGNKRGLAKSIDSYIQKTLMICNCLKSEIFLSHNIESRMWEYLFDPEE